MLGQAAKLAAAVNAVSADWNGFAVLHNAAARVGGLDIGFVPGEGGKNVAGMLRRRADVLFLLGADEIDMAKTGGAFVVYVGTHGDAGAHRANVILPGAAYTEKSGTYVNTEGRVQQTNRAGFAPGEAQGGLGDPPGAVGCARPASCRSIRCRSCAPSSMRSIPHLARIDQVAAGDADDIAKLAKLGGQLNKGIFTSPVKDFYLTNPIARASAVMAECSALAKNGFKQAAE